MSPELIGIITVGASLALLSIGLFAWLRQDMKEQGKEIKEQGNRLDKEIKEQGIRLGKEIKERVIQDTHKNWVIQSSPTTAARHEKPASFCDKTHKTSKKYLTPPPGEAIINTEV